MKLLHGNANIPDIKSIFGSDFSGCINMNVTPGSKSANLVPYAVKKFQSGETDTIIWWSKHGAVAKTVACAEMFKSIVLNAQTSQLDGSSPTKMYQCSRLHLQSCNCSVPDTTISCTLEEPGIAILFSKSQFPGEDCQLPVDFGGNSFSDFTNIGATSQLNLDHPPSRRRLSRTIRKKRNTVRDSNKNEAKFVNNCSSEMGDFHSVPFQTPRLSDAISNVNNVLKHKKLNRKRKKSSNQ
ncbi:unnamed protein product [Schistosoma rodhaini]|uniref:DNA/RNA-binding protein Alba-like domain-containing protein n=1 Tax=Schistosoma rodhaini TaxID=6188 RepID=A0AA85EM30_9TREM|nr:unnamed protein product [Schistosoma rodhaini]